MSDPKKFTKGIIPNLKYDLPSGLVVFLVALPLCLGIALASKTPPLSGLMAGIIGGLIVPLISRSSLSVSGPAAGLIAIVLTGIADMGGMEGGGFEKFLLAVFLAGILQMFIGIFKLGSIAHFFPSSVIRGMLAAIGLILILKQIPHALGYDHDYEGEMSFLQPDGENTFSEILIALSKTSVLATIISILSIGLLIMWDKVPALKKLTILPGALVVVIFGVAVNEIFHAMGNDLSLEGDHLVILPEFASMGAFVNKISMPDWGALGDAKVYVLAGTLAVVASLESLLSIEAVDRLDPFKRKSPPNRELIAQGFGNVFAGLLGALPITTVIVRSSANINSGGRTRTSSLVHGLLLVFSLLFLGALISRIPLAALAAILLMVGYKLAKPALFVDMYKRGKSQFIPFIVTILAVLFTDLLIGISVGLVVGIFYVLKANIRSAVYLEKSGKEFRVKFRKDLSFVNKAKLIHTLESIPDGATAILDGKGVEFIDYDLKEVLENFVENAPDRNIKIQIKHFYHLMPELKETVQSVARQPEAASHS